MNEHETHAAVVAEMRESDNEDTCPWWADGGDCVHCPMGGAGKNCPFDKFADRAEAAHKREIEKLNSVIQATVSHSDAEIDRLRREAKELRKQIGNAANLRDALKHIKDRLPHMLQYMRVHWEDASAGGYFDELMLVIDAALAAPPRNCDRFIEKSDVLKAYEKPVYCGKSASDFIDWLFAIEKGATDGK